MECYAIKGHGQSKDYMQIVRVLEEGYVIRIIRDLDGYEDITTDFMSKALFDSCVRTGYITKLEAAERLAANA